ncbi:MAG: lysozyme [Candidatus Bathyarchaeia archaeon]
MKNDERVQAILEIAIEMIKKHEGFVPVPTPCPAGYPTVGYGHRVVDGEVFSHVLDEQEALRLLKFDLLLFYNELLEVLPKIDQMPDTSVAALLSFVYNIGMTNFKKSTVLRILRQDNFDPKEVTLELKRWVYYTNKSGQKVQSKGLMNRREAEAELFLAGYSLERRIVEKRNRS